MAPSPHEPHPALDTRLPGPFDEEIPPQDPGTPMTRTVAFVAAVLLACTVMVWQHLPQATQNQALGLAPPAPDQSALVIAPLEPTSMYGRLIVKLKSVFATDPGSLEQFKAALETNLVRPEDHVAVAIILGELDGPDAALDSISQIESELDNPGSVTLPGSEDALPSTLSPEAQIEVRQDLDDLGTLYRAGSGALDSAAASRLTSRYGYIARVALTHDKDETDPEYAELRGGGIAILFGLFVFGGGLVLAFLVGTVLFILGLIRYLPRPDLLRFEPPAPGGSVMLETYALFVICFLAVSVAGTVLGSLRPELAIYTLIAQFAMMLLVGWPLLRGMSFKRWREAMGLVAPRGVLREIGFGFLAYLASVPLFVAGTLVTLVVVLIQESMRQAAGGSGPPEPPANDIIDLIGSANWLVIAFFALLATVWAPITEELIFRGALYRHLRSRLHWVFAALLSACLFAGMHSYPVFMLTPLVALGFTFAMMREIRGSIVASMTAHFIHNSTLVLVMAFVLRPLIA